MSVVRVWNLRVCEVDALASGSLVMEREENAPGVYPVLTSLALFAIPVTCPNINHLLVSSR